MVLNARTAFIPVMGAALAFQAAGCKKDKKDDKTDLLVGEWEVVLIDGQPPEDADEGYHITFEFQSDKDFQFCFKYEYDNNNYQSCYQGGWQWDDSDQDLLEFYWKDDDDEVYDAKINIETLTADELTGDLSADGEVYEVVLERVE